ncbi:MAG: PLD nuclease N-terminal domain-containing protein [Flavobacteriaceae bacterium]
MEFGIVGLIVLVADIYAIYKTLTSGASTGAKILWTLGILIFPVIGFIVWLIAGPKGPDRVPAI